MTATTVAATCGSRPELISATYRRLRRVGFEDPEAANLTAFMIGLPIRSQPWKVRELTRLLFVRELARQSGEWSGGEDRASTDGVDRWPIPGSAPRDPTQSDGRITLQSLLQETLGRTASTPERSTSQPGDLGRKGR